MRYLRALGLGRLHSLVAAFVLGGCSSQHYDGPVLDIHVHLDPPGSPDSTETGKVVDVPAVLGELKKLPRGSRAGVITIAPRGDMQRTRAQNDAVLAAAKDNPDRLWAIASVNPWDGEAALAELDRVVAAGARMLKLHPTAQAFDVDGPEVAKVAERAALRGIPILFDSYNPFDANQVGKFLSLALKQPKAKLILAHLNGPRFTEMLLFASLSPFTWCPKNVYFDLSVVTHTVARSPYRDQFVFLIRSLGTDHVMFGSDFPVVSSKETLEDVYALGLTKQEERQILHDTAASLLESAPK